MRIVTLSGMNPDLPASPRVLVYGQRELESMIRRGMLSGESRCSHLISIGEPRPCLRRPEEEERIPPVLRAAFENILRLGFSDVLSTEPRQRGRRPPSARDARRVVRFVERTAGESVGYAVHCWSGVSRSAAVALGILFMLRGDENAALRELLEVRPYAKPHTELLAHFDALLGSRLESTAAAMGPARLEELRKRLRKAADRDHGIEPGQ